MRPYSAIGAKPGLYPHRVAAGMPLEALSLLTHSIQSMKAGFGEPAPTVPPPREIPLDLLDRFSMNGKAAIEYNYLDGTYAANHPLIYTDAEIDNYIDIIARNWTLPTAKQDWFIYGTLDAWICEALDKYPVRQRSVVNMGSMTPWYEAMLIYFGGHPTTIDYNPIITRTTRMAFMTIADWERQRPVFDVGFSISSFEHDGPGREPINLQGVRLARSPLCTNSKQILLRS